MLEMTEEQEDKFIEARVILLSEHPFFGSLACHLKPRIVPMPTAAVTPDALFLIGPEFLESCNVRDLVWVVAHETMHLVTATSKRMPDGANHMVWNQASDIAINYLLSNPNEGANLPLPRPEVVVPLFGTKFKKYDDWTTEEIYYDLMKKAKNQKPGKCPDPNCPSNQSGKGQPGDGDGDGDDDGQGKGSGGTQPGPCPHGHGQCSHGNNGSGQFKGYWWDSSGKEFGEGDEDDENSGFSSEQEGEWKQRVAGAAAEARNAGKLPGALGNFITDLFRAKQDWKRILRLEANSALKKRDTWKRPGRRAIATTRTPGECPDIPVAVCSLDTSGSMSDEDLKDALAEMYSIAQLNGADMWLIMHDYEVYFCEQIQPEALKNLRVQRGGTSFIPIFEKIKEMDIRPEIFIGFSDLEGPFPSKRPKYPVIWCRPKGWKSEAPWGRIIDVEKKV